MEPLWPTEEDCPGYKTGKQKFAAQCHHVLLQLLSLLANGLQLPDNFFEEVNAVGAIYCYKVEQALCCRGKEV